MWRFLRWIAGKKGDMVWNTLVIVTVMLPLMGLTLDIPRYFILRSTLQDAADAAAEAAAQTLDASALINSGATQLWSSEAIRSAHNTFAAVAAPASSRGYQIGISAISIDESADQVEVVAYGKLRYMFGLTPEVTIQVRALSRYRHIGF